MTPEQNDILRAELKNDPNALGYAAHLPDDPQKVVGILAEPATTTMVAPLRTTTAKMWAARGPYARIVDVSNDVSHPCRASCLVIRESFACGDPIHLESPDIEEMLGVWVRAGITTQAEVDDLYQLATVPASRAEKLGIAVPTTRQILDAWGE